MDETKNIIHKTKNKVDDKEKTVYTIYNFQVEHTEPVNFDTLEERNTLRHS